MTELEQRIEELIDFLKCSDHTLALTGAGVSTESGIPDFRSENSGLWQVVNPMEVASYSNFKRKPRKFYDFWKKRFSSLSEAEPNITHRVLTHLEKKGLLKSVITQNIDNLHQKAGTKNVFECHGNYKRGYCIDCNREFSIQTILRQAIEKDAPYCSRCGGLLKPDVVLFGEGLPEDFQRSIQEVRRADLLICLGTSLTVYPVADLVPEAKRNRAKIAIINRDSTPWDSIADLTIHEDLGCVMEILENHLEEIP
jgi:NAD-dependent deacetylase